MGPTRNCSGGTVPPAAAQYILVSSKLDYTGGTVPLKENLQSQLPALQ